MTTTRNNATSAPHPTREGDQESAAAAFVQRFGQTWANPDPQRLNGLVHLDVAFTQPLEPDLRGHQQVADFWRRVFTLIPDLHGEVLSWGFRAGILYIELRMIGTLGGRPIEWVTLDRIRLEDGKVRQRTAYFNPLPLVRAVITRPRAWPRWLAAQRLRLTQ